MKWRLLVLIPVWFCSYQGQSQYNAWFWRGEQSLSDNIIASQLYPLDLKQRPTLDLAILTLPSLGMSSSLQAAFYKPLASVQGGMQLGFSALNIGPYAERSYRLSFQRGFGKSLVAYFQPEYHQIQVAAYPKEEGYGASMGISYTQESIRFSLTGSRAFVFSQPLSFIGCSASRKLSNRWTVSVSTRQQSGMPWQFMVDANLLIDDSQKLQLGAGDRHFFFLRYQKQIGRLTGCLSLSYSMLQGMYPENAFSYAW